MSTDRIGLIRAFLERSFPGHVVADASRAHTGIHLFSMRDPKATSARHWLGITEEALTGVDFNLEEQLTVALARTIRDMAAAGGGVVLHADPPVVRTRLGIP